MMSCSFQSTTNNDSVLLNQDFIPSLASIFTNVKDSELKDCKIPLLFIEDQSIVEQWVEIEKDYIKGKLPDV